MLSWLCRTDAQTKIVLSIWCVRAYRHASTHTSVACVSVGRRRKRTSCFTGSNKSIRLKVCNKILGNHGLSWWLSGKESVCQCRAHRRCGFDPWVRKIPWRTKWLPTPVLLPGKPHEQRHLACYGPWGCTRADRTEQLNMDEVRDGGRSQLLSRAAIWSFPSKWEREEKRELLLTRRNNCSFKQF